jgi:hypothetical protein
MSDRAAPVASLPAASRTRGTARRRTKRDSQAVVVASLTVLATGIALFDLLLLAIGLQ